MDQTQLNEVLKNNYEEFREGWKNIKESNVGNTELGKWLEEYQKMFCEMIKIRNENKKG